MMVQETKVLEALNYGIDVPCIVQWSMLWHSAPLSLNNDLLNDGMILEQYSETINLTIEKDLSFCLSGEGQYAVR